MTEEGILCTLDGTGQPMAIESRKVTCRRPLMAVTEMTDCGRWVRFGPKRRGFIFDLRTGQKIEFSPTPGGWHLTMKLEPPERANKILNKAIQEIIAKKRAAVEVRGFGAITDTERLVRIMGCDPFRRPAGFQPVRLENRTNNLENICGLDDTDDEDNADELGESGGVRARPQPRNPSTREVEAHMIDHYPFRSWCRYCAMAASRSDHHRRQAEDYNEVPVISCDCGFFFTDSRNDERQLPEVEAKVVGATPILVIRVTTSKMTHADCTLQRN